MSLNSRTMKYVPTSSKKGQLVAMGFGVEAGDLEIISSSTITDVLCDGNRSFVGVIARTPHDVSASGAYVGYSEDDMISIRLQEAIKAANIGSYQALYLLNDGELLEVNEELVNDYSELLLTYKPDVIYTFSPFDQNHEHIVSIKAVLFALKRIKDQYQPRILLGVNTEGDLAALASEELVKLEIEDRVDFIKAMLSVYVTYDEEGIKLSPAKTAIDLTPLLKEEEPSLARFVLNILEKIKNRILENLK